MSTAVDAADTATDGESPSALSQRGARFLRAGIPHLPVVVFMAMYAAYFSRLTIEIYRGYGQPGFDMGLYDQGLWLLSRFHAPFVTIMGRDLFGDHAALILLLVVPLYWIYPSVVTLCVLQSIVLALGALPIYLVARRYLGGYVVPSLLAGAVLLSPALQGGNLEQFHPDCFLVPLVGFAIYAALTWRPWMLVTCAVLCLLVKEDAALLIVPLGIWVWYRRDQRIGARLVVGSLLAAFVSVQVVMKGFFGVPELHADRIPFGGLHGLLTQTLRKPGTVVKYFLGQGRPFYLWQMAIPSGLLFLRAPEIAAIAAMALGANVLSTFGYQHLVQYHYSLAIVPIIAIGTVYALAKVRREQWRLTATVAIVLLSLWSTYLWGELPALSQNKVPHWKPSNPEVHNIDAVLSALPPNAVVSAQYSYLTHIDHRVRVYQWPTPFRAAYWGLLNEEGRRLPFADQIQYLVLPVNLDSNTAPVFEQIRSQFVVVRRVGDVWLLRRSASGP